jgi:hypothetical protein
MWLACSSPATTPSSPLSTLCSRTKSHQRGSVMLTLCTSSGSPLSNDDARPNASDTTCLGGIDTDSFANTIGRATSTLGAVLRGTPAPETHGTDPRTTPTGTPAASPPQTPPPISSKTASAPTDLTRPTCLLQHASAHPRARPQRSSCLISRSACEPTVLK